MLPKFICPECGREAELCVASLVKFMCRLDLPYFVCVPCQTVYYDKRMVWERVTRLREMDFLARRTPFRFIYRMAKEHLERIVQHRIEYFGARLVRFRKKGSDDS